MIAGTHELDSHHNNANRCRAASRTTCCSTCAKQTASSGTAHYGQRVVVLSSDRHALSLIRETRQFQSSSPYSVMVICFATNISFHCEMCLHLNDLTVGLCFLPQHKFCSICGICSWYIPRSHPDSRAITLHCLDAIQKFDFTTEIIHFDGQNWEENVDSIRDKKIETL